MSPNNGVRTPSMISKQIGAALFLSTILLLAVSLHSSAAYQPWWVQNHQKTQLWSGPDADAVSFGSVPQWSYFQVVAPQQGSRLYVLNPVTHNYAYIDASAVGPSAPPPADGSPSPSPAGAAPAAAPSPDGGALSTSARPERTPPKLTPEIKPWWVANFEPTELWAGPELDSASLTPVPQFRGLMVIGDQQGSRLPVWYPEKDVTGYLDAAVAGPSSPSVWIDPHPVKEVKQVGLPGRSTGSKSYVRSLPVRDPETRVRYVPNNTRLQVQREVEAADGSRWYVVNDGLYIAANEVRLPTPPGQSLPGRWIDADLSEPAMVTFYEGDKPVYSALAIKGTVTHSTPKGTFKILRRVEDETMDSETLIPPIPRTAKGGYYLEHVLYTQYFTPDGASLHYNYWTGTFGYAGSHGCLGLNLEDARWLWDWASIGTPVVVR